MQYLTVEDVVAFYAEAIGVPALRSPDGLASAVGRPQQSAFGEDAYPTIALKAAALDRMDLWEAFLQLHGYTTDKEALDLFMNFIANGMTVEDLAAWIERHLSASKPPDR